MSKQIFLYFNSWGGTEDQALYLKNPISKLSKNFYTFTFGMPLIGGFDYDKISGNGNSFRNSVIKVFNKAIKQIIRLVNEIIEDNEDYNFVLMSHSLGYTILFLTLFKSKLMDNIDRCEAIILLDPAGKSINKEELIRDSVLYSTFIKKFINFNKGIGNNNIFSDWKVYIDSSTKVQFTRTEKDTGMYRYIVDADNSSYLTLSIYAYAINFFNISKYIEKITGMYPNLINLLTTTNGLAYENLSYWKSLGIDNIKIVSDAGHFLHIYSQIKTIKQIYKILDKNYITFSPYLLTYNAPLNNPI